MSLIDELSAPSVHKSSLLDAPNALNLCPFLCVYVCVYEYEM